jgi:hypothetical protein
MPANDDQVSWPHSFRRRPKHRPGLPRLSEQLEPGDSRLCEATCDVHQHCEKQSQSLWLSWTLTLVNDVRYRNVEQRGGNGGKWQSLLRQRVGCRSAPAARADAVPPLAGRGVLASSFDMRDKLVEGA